MREYLMKGLGKIIAAKCAIIKVALLLLIFVTRIPWFCHADIPAVERQALIAPYNSTNGDNWTNNSGWKDAPLHTDGFAMTGTESSWYGVTCDDLYTKVTGLNLYDNKLAGGIPLELGNFSTVQFRLMAIHV